MTKKQITRTFLRRASELNTHELVFFDDYVNSIASKDTFPPVQHISNCIEALLQALPPKTLQTLQKNRPTHLSILFNALDMLLRPGQWSITKEETIAGTFAHAQKVKPSRKPRRKK